MINSITLSSDMQTLYLIDNGRTIAFPLTTSNGVLIGTLQGQVTVATAMEAPQEPEEKPVPEKEQDFTRPIPPMEVAKAVPLPLKSTFPTSGNQWTVFFNAKREYLAVIGATDIDVGQVTPNPTPKIKLFSLKETILNLRRRGDALEVIVLAKKF